MHIRIVIRAITWGGAVCSLLLLMDAIADGAISNLALTGEQAVGLPAGVQYRDNFGSNLNSSGQVVLTARLMGTGVTSSNDKAIWMGTPGAMNLLARTGDPAPGMGPGVVITANLFADFTRSDNGQVFLSGQLSGPGIDASNQNGIWRGRPGDLHLVARSGDPAPGTPPGVTFSGFYGGTNIIRAVLTGPGVTPENDHGLWLVGDNGTTLVFREGDQAPGAPAGVKFGFEFDTPLPHYTFDSTGRVAFLTRLTGPGLTPDNDIGLWVNQAGATTLIARQGDPAPGTGAGVVYRLHPYDVTRNQYADPVLQSGQIGFRSGLGGPGITTANDNSIWVGPPADVTLRLRDGQLAPGTGLPFRYLGVPHLNDAGQIVFAASVDSPNLSDYAGIWSLNDDGMRLIARQGQQAPGSEGSVYNTGLSGILYGGQIAINSAGQIAFGSGLNQDSGASVTSLNSGFWIDDAGQQIRVVGSGDILAGQTVFNVNYLDANLQRNFNDLGQLAFWANFDSAGQVQGLFLYQPAVPEPVTLLPAALGCLLLSLRRHRGVR